jgi:hypothetical protein
MIATVIEENLVDQEFIDHRSVSTRVKAQECLWSRVQGCGGEQEQQG